MAVAESARLRGICAPSERTPPLSFFCCTRDLILLLASRLSLSPTFCGHSAPLKRSRLHSSSDEDFVPEPSPRTAPCSLPVLISSTQQIESSIQGASSESFDNSTDLMYVSTFSKAETSPRKPARRVARAKKLAFATQLTFRIVSGVLRSFASQVHRTNLYPLKSSTISRGISTTVAPLLRLDRVSIFL